MGITDLLIHYFTHIIEKADYIGVGILMTLESMVAPVPSEAVLPFAGFLWYEGKFSFVGILIASTVGSVVGSLLSYYIGAYGGRPLVKKFGKFLLLNEGHLDKTERFFRTYGDKTIFFSRFIPVVRHLISIPAGVGRMNPVKFALYTVLGAGLWNALLSCLGFILKSRWEIIRQYTEIVDIIIVIGIFALLVYYLYKLKKSRRSAGSKPDQPNSQTP